VAADLSVSKACNANLIGPNLAEQSVPRTPPYDYVQRKGLAGAPSWAAIIYGAKLYFNFKSTGLVMPLFMPSLLRAEVARRGSRPAANRGEWQAAQGSGSEAPPPETEALPRLRISFARNVRSEAASQEFHQTTAQFTTVVGPRALAPIAETTGLGD